MSDPNHLERRFPGLAARFGREYLANLPTPLQPCSLNLGSRSPAVLVKRDDLTGDLYGGNKLRKLEYALRPARDRKRQLIATFGAVGSNHALATAIYARHLGYACTCLLVHQQATEKVRQTLLAHLAVGTSLVRFGGGREKRVDCLRRALWNKGAWVVPAGGSSWRGTAGFVNAGLELAEQLEVSGEDPPERIYIATGTMGSAAGLALGLALAGLGISVEAVRVSMSHIANEEALQRLVFKTAYMLNRLDPTIPRNIAAKTRIRMRHDFFASGYAKGDDRTDEAIAIAAEQMGLELETTYTAKAMAALLSDLRQRPDLRALYWHTYNSRELPQASPEVASGQLPDEFLRYLD